MKNNKNTVMDGNLRGLIHMEYSLADIMETINQLKEKYPDEMRKILKSEKISSF